MWAILVVLTSPLFDLAPSKADIVKKTGLALNRTETQEELEQLLKDIPGFIKRTSRNFGEVSAAIVSHLLQDPINKVRKRLGLNTDLELPADERRLRLEIERLLRADLSDPLKDQLKTILDALSRLSRQCPSNCGGRHTGSIRCGV